MGRIFIDTDELRELANGLRSESEALGDINVEVTRGWARMLPPPVGMVPIAARTAMLQGRLLALGGELYVESAMLHADALKTEIDDAIAALRQGLDVFGENTLRGLAELAIPISIVLGEAWVAAPVVVDLLGEVGEFAKDTKLAGIGLVFGVWGLIEDAIEYKASPTASKLVIVGWDTVVLTAGVLLFVPAAVAAAPWLPAIALAGLVVGVLRFGSHWGYVPSIAPMIDGAWDGVTRSWDVTVDEFQSGGPAAVVQRVPERLQTEGLDDAVDGLTDVFGGQGDPVEAIRQVVAGGVEWEAGRRLDQVTQDLRHTFDGIRRWMGNPYPLGVPRA